ncbi:MAG: hydantoinase B/oxoprolinase family protein [Rhodospirillales bacterium]|nr:hydantoinase B/oxoprolinase family protein [Rhodospirillales bacterium]
MDPVLLEILANKVTAIADEMQITMQRTSRSVFVNEASDFAVGLIDLEGEVFVWPPGSKITEINVHAAHTIGAVALEPDDVIVSNDPYLSQGMSTHLPDLHLIRPYYHEDRLVAYGWGFIHYMDVGGRVPGSMTIKNTEIFQEGIRIPPMKIVKGGKLNADFVKIFQANCRLPDINMADIHSTLGCLEVGAKRVAETIALYGADTFIECQEALKAYSAAKVRAALRRLPDGVYDFWDYLDDDLVSDIPIRMRLRMTIADGTLHFDLTGTDPQVPAAYNVPTVGILHNWLTRRITTFIRTHDDTIPLNAGLYRDMTATNPPGTVLNAEFPDPVSERHATATSFNNAVTGALLKAAPDLMAGPTCGTGAIIVYTEPGAEGEATSVIIVQSLRGGMSAYKGGDGVDGRDVTMNTMHNHPIETIEGKCALRVVEYDVAIDSGGPGRWRGGVGQTMILEVLREGCTLQVRGLDRLRFPSWGVMGGKHGALPRFVLNQGKPGERQLGKAEELRAAVGDTITVVMEGAAGYGDPYLRDPDAVRSDVVQSFVSREGAARDYGVVITDDDSVNEDATAAARAARVKKNIGADFDFGPEREAWERVFDDATMSDLNQRLYALPKSVRHATRRRIIERAAPNLPKAGLGSLVDALRDADAVRARLKAAMGDILGAGATQPAEQAAQ